MHVRSAVVAAAVTALTVGLIAPTAGSAAADPNDPGSRKQRVTAALGDLRDDLNESSAQLRAAAAALKSAEAKLEAARADVRRAAAEVAAAQRREAQLVKQLDLAQRSQARAERAVAKAESGARATRDQAAEFARTAYMNRGLGKITAIIGAESTEDVVRRAQLQRLVGQKQRSVLAKLAADRAQARVDKSVLTAQRELVAKARAEQAAVVGRKVRAEQASRSAARAVLTLVDARRAALAAIQRERTNDLKQYQAMQAQSRQLSALLRARASTGGTTVYDSDGVFLHPVSGPITSPYGMRVHPVTGVYKLHDGTDFGVGCGTPVRAAASGEVVSAGYRGGYGNQLVIDHGSMRAARVATSYNHLSGFAVRGGTVSRGQVIGYVGSTGYSTGCHLHFMVYVNGDTVNPMGWL